MASLIESLTTFLFKYPPRVYERGELVFAPSIWPGLIIALGAAALALVVIRHLKLRSVSTTDRVILSSLRALTFLLLFACLLRPALVVTTSVPQRNVLAVLMDDSRSQRIRDENGQTRLSQIQSVFADSSHLLKGLSDRYAIRFLSFGADGRGIQGASDLNAGATRTDIASALDATRQELNGVPLAGIVLVSDGADNSDGDMEAALLGLRSRKIPVYSVGVGSERFDRDVSVERITAASSVLAGGVTLIDASVRLRGTGSEAITVTAEADGRIVATEKVTAAKGNEMANVRLRLPSLPAGTWKISVRASTLPNEIVPENNIAHTVLHVRAGPDRILYLEGEPRPEFAFLRRAIAADSGVQLVGLLRSAEGKFLRLGVKDSMELLTGFPSTREELFEYRALVLGSIEASFFTGDQLRMLADFVNVRGGGLLALGGRNSLSEGGYRGTPLADVLPVVLDGEPRNSDDPIIKYSISPTSAARHHAALQIGETEAASLEKWSSLPQLSAVNSSGTLRPGATLLLSGKTEDGSSDRALLSYHRYGRGVGAVFGVQDSWLWRMHADIAVEDETHIMFWRQFLRWLSESSPERVTVTALPDRSGTGESITIRAQVSDADFLDVNDAAITTTVISPSGTPSEINLEWSVRADGIYEGEFTPSETGSHTLSTRVIRSRDTMNVLSGAFLVDDADADVANAEQRVDLLKRIASETGGTYMHVSNSERLLDDVDYTESGIVVRDTRDLWDMPIVLIFILALLATEWSWRRWRGLA